MKRVSILILVVLIGGIAVYGGVKSNVDEVAAGLSGGVIVGSLDAAAEDFGQTAGEVSVVFFGGETTDEASPTEAPSAFLELSHDTAETGDVVRLDASGSSGSSIVLYEWDLDGDGSYDATTEVPAFVHVFAEDGIYAIRVRITDSWGATGESRIVELIVLNRAPAARFTIASASRDDVARYEFRSTSADVDGEIVRWSWDFGDGTLSEEPNPLHSYSDDGTYSVTLVVADEDGEPSAPAVRTLVVENADPVAAFAFGVDSIAVGESVSFVDESVDPSPSGSIVHVAWDFGDGSYHAGGPSADGEYAHTYTTAGVYTVTLYVIDDDGGMGSVRQIIFVT